MSREFDGYRLNKQREFFNNTQKKIVESWVYGFKTPTEVAAHLGLAEGTIKHADFEIIDKLKEHGPGTDRRAKAVTFTAQKGWLDPSFFPDKLERKLTDSEILVLTFRIRGFTRKEVSNQLKYSEDEVNENLDAIQKLIGVETDYGAIAWAIIKVLNKNQPSKPK